MLISRQLEIEQRPQGDLRPLAVLKWEPEDMPVDFEDTYDNLDYVRVAAIEVTDGRQFVFRRYRGAPMPGIDVYVAADDSQMPRALSSLLRALEIEPDGLRWVSPLARQPIAE